MSDDNYRSYDEFAHRQQHPIKDIPVFRQDVHKIVEQLLDLEARTHPQNPNPGGKEPDSIWALILAGKLVERLVGWAIDHRAGLVLNEVEGFPWPEGDERAEKAAEDHRHEVAGSGYFQGNAMDSFNRSARYGSLTDRRILAAVVSKAPVLPSALHTKLATSLKALDLGETTALFSEAPNQRTASYFLWQSRLRAIEHVYFWVGMKYTKKDAIIKVAEAYHRGPDAVITWDKAGLDKHLSKGFVDSAKQGAQRLGENVYRMQNTIPKTEANDDFIHFHLSIYGDKALARNAQEFRDLETRAKEGKK